MKYTGINFIVEALLQTGDTGLVCPWGNLTKTIGRKNGPIN